MTGRREERKERLEKLCVIRHDGEKLLLVDLAILVKVKLVYHRLSEGHHHQPARRRKWRNRITYNSSSSSRSPISLATRRRFRMDIFPVLSSSNSWNARRISSIGSRANIFSVTVYQNNKNNQHYFSREKTCRVGRRRARRANATDLDEIVILE